MDAIATRTLLYTFWASSLFRSLLCVLVSTLNSHTHSLTTSYLSSVRGSVGPEIAHRFLRVCCVFLGFVFGWWHLCPYGMDSVKCSMWFGFCPSLATSFQCFLTKHPKAGILPELMTQHRMQLLLNSEQYDPRSLLLY